MSATWTTVALPAEASPNFVLVEGIAKEADAAKVTEFFTFCGKIDQFELRPSADGEAQEALIHFEKDSAAKTAVLLSNAMIAEKPIEVRFFFDQYNVAASPVPELPKEGEAAQRSHIDEAATLLKDRDLPQEEKPKSSIFYEIIANGYLLSEKLVKTAYEYDSRYGLSDKAQSLVGQARQSASALDERFKVSENIKNIDEKYKIHDKVNNLTTQATALSNQALQSPAGQRVVHALQQAKESGVRTYEEGVKLAEEKKRQSTDAETPPAAAPTTAATEPTTTI
ncbi:Protein vip1 [Dimargaris cristalligena]|nr:Protein vip1 [Dimargaris cristalligena]